jgi:hypothetical protein
MQYAQPDSTSTDGRNGKESFIEDTAQVADGRDNGA